MPLSLTRMKIAIFTQSMAEDWSELEVELIVADYFAMFIDELQGIPFNKAKHNRELVPKLNNRSKGAIEFKHANISAALAELGQPYIIGYQPRFNFQRKTIFKVLDYYLSKHKQILEPLFTKFSDSSTIQTPEIVDFEKVIESPPKKEFIVNEPQAIYKRPNKINYLEREQQNIALGSKGEEFVIKFERIRLQREGKLNLADKIEWIAKENDAAGFDILSFNKNGTDRYIEVKTTKLAKETPIFFSKGEYEFSKVHSQNYNLYRLFNFDKSPKMFQLNGDFDSFCNKEAINYKGFF